MPITPKYNQPWDSGKNPPPPNATGLGGILAVIRSNLISLIILGGFLALAQCHSVIQITE